MIDNEILHSRLSYMKVRRSQHLCKLGEKTLCSFIFSINHEIIDYNASRAGRTVLM